MAASDNNADQCYHRASAEAESVRNDLPRAPCPQAILKVWPPKAWITGHATIPQPTTPLYFNADNFTGVIFQFY